MHALELGLHGQEHGGSFWEGRVKSHGSQVRYDAKDDPEARWLKGPKPKEAVCRVSQRELRPLA